MNATFLVGVFLLPRLARRDATATATATKLAALSGGTALFLYANYGDALAGIVPAPPPAAVLGPVATYALSERTTAALLAVTNSLLTNPVAVAGFAAAMNYVLAREELTSIPVVRHTLPERDPWRIVAASAALGTAFYLLVVAGYTGRLALVP